jgi:undecaprenyl diphosphate synthase
MDGNGRWARQRGLPRFAGHRAGASIVRTITEHAARIGLKQLTLYSFSTENWNRPEEEVNLLMDLYVEYMQANRNVFMDNNIQFAQIGRREGLPPRVLEELNKTLEMTRGNTGMTLCLAINYGSRAEITDAVTKIAEKIRKGEIAPQDITQDLISAHLYTANMPDPDLLIRTAGELRVSNYLLWQISYAEIYVTQTFWPDFDAAAFDEALRNYGARKRRFGGVDESNT